MPNTKPEALPRVGCDQLHVAKMLTDTKEGATYDDPVHFQNVKSVGFQPGSSISTFYADDGPPGQLRAGRGRGCQLRAGGPAAG